MYKTFLGVPCPLYFDLCFYNRPWKIRKYFILNDVKYCEKYNLGAKEGGNSDKTSIIEKTRPFLKRDVILTKNLSLSAFLEFLSTKASFFYKPIDGCEGKGIQKIQVSDFPDKAILFDKMKALPNGILEETIVQHPILNKLCPNLLQTIRVTVF